MNRETFLKELGAALSNLSRAEREEAVTYYDEMIRDAVEAGQDEETAVGRLGAPADVARQILADAAGESGAPEPTEVPGDGVWEAGAAVHAVVVDAQDVPVRVVPGACRRIPRTRRSAQNGRGNSKTWNAARAMRRSRWRSSKAGNCT